VATPAAFAALRRYLPALRRLVEDVIKAGGSVHDAEGKHVPAAFSDWTGTAFRGNVRFLYERATAGKS
jgi:hypothetical protein